MKRKLFNTLIAVSMLFSCVSCNNSDSSAGKQETSIIENSDLYYSLNENKLFDTNKISCFSLLDNYKDGFIFSGMRYGADNQFKIETIHTGTGAENNKVININDSEVSISTIKKYKDELIALSCYNGIYTLLIYDDEGNEKRRKDLDFYPVDIQIQNDVMYLLDYENSKIRCYSSELEFVSDFNIDSNNYIPNFIRVSENNHVFCLAVNKVDNDFKIFQLDGSREEKREDIGDMDKIIDFYPDKSGGLYIIGKENNEDSRVLVDHIDEKGNITDMSEIDDCSGIYGMTSSESIIYSGVMGISEHSCETDKTLYKYNADDVVYSVNVVGNEVSVFINDAVTCTDTIFAADAENNVYESFLTNAIEDAVTFNDDIYYCYQDNEQSGVRCINDGKICETGICSDEGSFVSIAVTANENIILYMYTYNGETLLLSYDSSYRLISEKKCSKDIADIIALDDDIYVFEEGIIYKTDSKFKTRTDLLDTGRKNEYPEFHRGNSEFSFIIEYDDDITGYSAVDNTETLIAKKTDLISGETGNVLMDIGGRLIVNDNMSVYKAERNIKSSEKDHKTNLKLACFFNDVEFNDAVKKYNSQNSDCNVEIVRYDISNDDEAVSKFDADILSGNIPDIILTSENYINIPAYVRNGIFADFNEFMKDDQDINIDSTNENIIRAFELDGKLYIFPSFYRLKTIASSYSNDGKELPDFINDIYKSESIFLGSLYGRPLWDLSEIYLYGDNKDKLQVNENRLHDLVRFYFKYREPAKDNDNGELKTIYDYTDYIHWFDFDFGDTESFYMNSAYNYHEDYDIGYTDNISGTVYPKLAFSITEKSGDKEAAWEFVKYITSLNDLYDKTGMEYYNILKSNLPKFVNSDVPKCVVDNYNNLLNGKWYNIYYDFDILELIFNELYNEDDLNADEKSERIMNALNKYYFEVR